MSPEQFCGLIKIQQESARTQAKISLQRNMLTIRQVANVLDAQEASVNPSPKPFHQLAVEMNYISATEAETLLKAQESSGVSINDLMVECGLLTESQNRVLYAHFLRTAFRTAQKPRESVSTAPQAQPAPQARPTAPATPYSVGPRQPNFKRRPAIIQNRQVQI